MSDFGYGPDLVYSSNGEAGDGQHACSGCGTEQDERHSWAECQEAVRQSWSAEIDARVRAEVQLSALREALRDARQSLQGWATHPDAEPYASWDPPHTIQDPNGTRDALARIDAALASTEPGGEERKP